MASEVRWHAARHGEGAEGPSEGERTSEADGCQSGFGHGNPEGVGEGKLVSPERRRRTIEEIRRRLGPRRISERRVCRVLGQARSTQRYASRRPVDEAQLPKEMHPAYGGSGGVPRS